MRRYVLSEDTIIAENQRVTTMHPLFDAVDFLSNFRKKMRMLYLCGNGENVGIFKATLQAGRRLDLEQNF